MIVCVIDPIDLGIIGFKPDTDSIAMRILLPKMILILTIGKTTDEIIVTHLLLMLIPNAFDIEMLFFKKAFQYPGLNDFEDIIEILLWRDGDDTFHRIIDSVFTDAAILELLIDNIGYSKTFRHTFTEKNRPIEIKIRFQIG